MTGIPLSLFLVVSDEKKNMMVDIHMHYTHRINLFLFSFSLLNEFDS